MRSFLLSRLLPLMAVAVLFWACEDADTDTVNLVNPGDAVPAFTVSAPDGTTFNSASFTGKRSLLLLFASWCPTCQQALPYIEQVWQHFRDDPDVLVIPVSRDEAASDIETYWEKREFEMPVYLDPGRAVFDRFANQTVPRIYLIGTAGTVTQMWVGEVVSSGTLIQNIQELP